MRRAECQTGGLHQQGEQYISYLVQPNFKRLGTASWAAHAGGQEASDRKPTVPHCCNELSQTGHVVLTLEGERSMLDDEDLRSACRPNRDGLPPKGTSSSSCSPPN